MKLSQAILLGSTICKAGNANSFDSGESRNVGCGIEMALEAIGSHEDWVFAGKYWSWLTKEKLMLVACRFDAGVLVDGETLESFIDWVASIEPPETCSECRSEQPVNEIQVCQECQR
jgi:hypothetical protein